MYAFSDGVSPLTGTISLAPFPTVPSVDKRDIESGFETPPNTSFFALFF